MIYVLLATIAVVGLIGGGAATIARICAKHWLPELYERRPLNCPVCMGFWCALGSIAAMWVSGAAIFHLMAPFTAAAFLLFGGTAIAAYVNHAILPPTFRVP